MIVDNNRSPKTTCNGCCYICYLIARLNSTHQGNLLLHFVFVPVVDLITAIERFWLQKCKPSIFSQYCSTIHKWPLLKYCACCLTQFRHDHLYQDHHDHRRHHHDHQCHRHDHHWKMTNIKIFQMLPSKLLGRTGCLHRKYFQLGMVFNSNDCVQILITWTCNAGHHHHHGNHHHYHHHYCSQ